MEILIPGLILVALMVYASTKIKKHAARAYEPETVETDKFSILKPDGFINPVEVSDEHLFIAYSKEFGAESARDLRQATASVRVFPEDSFEELCERAKGAHGAIEAKTADEKNGGRTCDITARSEKSGVPIDLFYRISARHQKTYQLRISVLSEHKDDYMRRIEEMRNSFVLK